MLMGQRGVALPPSLVALRELVGWNGDDLFIAACLVVHEEHAHRTDRHHRARHDGYAYSRRHPVANTRAIVPGAVMAVRPVGVLFMDDEAGGDEKIIAVPANKLTKRYEKVASYTDLPSITIDQIKHFFEHYKDLEPNKWVKVIRWGDAEEAKKLILEGIERHNAKKAKG